jgi:hypothetical protein
MITCVDNASGLIGFAAELGKQALVSYDLSKSSDLGSSDVTGLVAPTAVRHTALKL